MNSPVAPIPASALADLVTLYDAGRYVTAHARAVERFGPLAGWSGGAAALTFAGRLAGNVGGDHLAHALTLRARRRCAVDPAATAADRAAAVLFHAFHVFGRRGPLAVRRLLARPGVAAAFAAGADDETRADVLCLRAHVAAAFRDAEAAETHWQHAHALAPTRPWTWRERAALLVALDRHPEALDAARESLRLRPWYRPAVQQAAHILTLLGRDDEAAALLADAIDPKKGGLESAATAGQLAAIYAELQRPADALRALDLHESWSPLLEPPGRQALAARRGEARLLLDDLPGAADAADALAPTSVFHAKTAGRLRDPARRAARRVSLPVPFVRQHEKTCAPATLAALSRYWNRPADHAAITREIWYGGTFEHQERSWAETHGWVAREFRADWASAVALLDLGIPFTLATTGVNTGHLQACTGYDARRGTLVIRDPFERNQSEPLADEFFQQHAFCGPRAMALVPADDGLAGPLAALDLPEAALHDALYRLRRALHVHDRPGARAALDRLESLDPEARLTLFGRRELALYDGDDPAMLAAIEGLLARYPDSRLRLEKLHALRRLARPAEARARLEGWVADPAQSEPNLWRELGTELAADARQRPRARLLLARALFFQPTEPAHLHALATLRWDERDFEESAALFRLAACAATTREDFWRQFFTASRHLRETDAALGLLDARFRRLGGQSAQPARTLFWAHRERHAAAPAAAVLAEALQRRPDDGEMLLFAATAHARDGEHGRAAEFLASARGKAPPGAFGRAAAELCARRGDPAGALTHWREILAREPLDPGAWQAAARLIAETDARGPVAAREFLDAAVARFPHSVALHALRVQSLVEDPGRGNPAHVAAVDALLAVQGANVWAHRERALALLARRDPAGALGALDETERLDPLAPPTHALRGRALLMQGDRTAARASLRRALELDVDLPGATAALLETGVDPAEKRGSLDFVHGELLRQSGSIGDGVLAYRAAAYPFLEDHDLQTRLDAVLAARPDAWQAWSAVASQHADARRLDPAHTHALAAAERFPLLPSAWMDLAAVEKLRGADDAQIAALHRALRLRADLGDASRQLADAHRRAGRFAEARAVLERAIAAAPLTLLNVQLEDKDFAAAEETLRFFERHHPGAVALSRAVLVAAGRKDKARAREALTQLSRTRPAADAADGGLKEAVEAATRAGWRGMTETILRAALHAPPGTGHPEAGAHWVRSRAARGRWFGLAAVMNRLTVADETARRALLAYIGALGMHQRRFRLRRALRRSRAALRGDAEAWGEAGHALVTCGLNREAAAWMGDWRVRAGVTPLMLSHLVLALRRSGWDSHGLLVSRHALTLPPDRSRDKHAVWTALEAALGDDPAMYQEAVELHAGKTAETGEMAPAFRFLHTLTGHLLAVRGTSDPAERAAAWRIARNRLRTERREAAAIRRGNPDIARADLRARRRMARDVGDRWTTLALAFSPPPMGRRTRFALAVLLGVLWVGCLTVGLLMLARAVGWL